jgi:hypothetical protein
MELKISEFTDNFNDYDFQDLNNNQTIEKIPENTMPIKVIKKGVKFDDSIGIQQKPTHQAIPKVNAKIARSQIPYQKPKISYDDILTKMGMLVSDGKLHLVDRNNSNQQINNALKQSNINLFNDYDINTNTNTSQSQDELNIPTNSYIYNKFFKEEIQPQNIQRKPRSIQEYKSMLVRDYIQRQRIKQMKSTKLIMPNSNINISGGNTSNLNKLFNFSKR